MCLSLFTVNVDNTIMSVTLPSLVAALDASTTDLQWVVDAFALTFAGLLLAAGAVGDRYGRRLVLTVGLVVFGLFSALGSFAVTPGQLIAARAAMGVGAALVFPATLAILSDVFREPASRARAIGAWTAVAGLAVAVGPLAGGWLLEHFWWGSVLLVNLPVVAGGRAGWRLVVRPGVP